MPPQPQATVADNSVAALSTTSFATPLAATTPSPQVAQSEVLQTESTTAAPFTTIGIASGLGAASTQTSTAGSTATVVAVPSSGSGSNGNGSTIAVAGGVIGGVALVSLVAFFIWFWRRRVLKRRRSTLLTPLTPDPSFGVGLGEKRSYFIRQDSIGPTPRSTKVKAVLKNQYGRVRGRFNTLARSGSVRSTASHSSARSVDMNRGNSQFMDTTPIIGQERKNSSAALSAHRDSGMTVKERVMELLARLKGSRAPDAMDDKNDIFAARGLDGSMKEKQTSRTRPLTNKPDFLTLLNMDDGELDREAQRRRISRTRGGSEGSGLGGLSLDFGGDPFSDVNALAYDNSKAAPLVVSGANNPFSDVNAIKAPQKPSTYVNEIRRSRNLSMAGSSTIGLSKAYDIQGLRIVNNVSRPPSGAAAAGPHESFYPRDSTGSFESFTTKRDKFRSDPFDLEQLSSQVSESMPSYLSRPPVTPALPAAAHTRKISDVSSKYTSGISDSTLDEWSEPGPDVGPGAQGIWDASRRSSTAARYQPYSDRSESGSRRTSQGGSVKMGYAL